MDFSVFILMLVFRYTKKFLNLNYTMKFTFVYIDLS